MTRYLENKLTKTVFGFLPKFIVHFGSSRLNATLLRIGNNLNVEITFLFQLVYVFSRRTCSAYPLNKINLLLNKQICISYRIHSYSNTVNTTADVAIVYSINIRLYFILCITTIYSHTKLKYFLVY